MALHDVRDPRVFVPGLGTVLLLLAAPAPAFPLPPQMQMTGVVRDFRAFNQANGHPSMQQPNKPANLGPKWVIGNLVEPILGPDRKPVLTNAGIIVSSPWKDGSGRNISMQLAALDPQPTDQPGIVTNAWNDYLDSASFQSLFNDELGINLSVPLTLTFNLQANGTYLYDADNDPTMSGGFFPIDGQLLGNYNSHNFHFTFELHGQFLYEAAVGQIFEFNGDDDVWVYISDQLVVDLGGRHSAKSMFVEMDRLGLTDGEIYKLDFFLMERRTSGSHCKITTNLPLEMPTSSSELSISAPFD